MTPNQLPPLPEPDTHCFDDDTGKDVWSYTADQMHAYALAALAQQAQPVYQVRGAFSSDPVNTWRDATETAFYFHPVNQRRILYATPPAPQVPAPVDERDELEADMADKAAVMPAAVVAEVYQSRYTIEWVNGPMPLGTNLYAGPKVVKAWAEEVRKLRAERDALAALQSPAPQAGGWLPIESAPKDGTRLILWWGGKPVFAGWLDNSQCKHSWAGWQTPSLTPRPQGEPTHYMPPPPAPQTKGQP